MYTPKCWKGQLETAAENSNFFGGDSDEKNLSARHFRAVLHASVVGSYIVAGAEPLRWHLAHEHGPSEVITQTVRLFLGQRYV